jgi:hypothetical protein
MKSELSHCAKQPAAKRKSTSMQSKTDWARLKAGAAPKTPHEHPEADVSPLFAASFGADCYP